LNKALKGPDKKVGKDLLCSLNHKSKICAVIPFYNEKDYLLDVVLETLKYVDKVMQLMMDQLMVVKKHYPI